MSERDSGTEEPEHTAEERQAIEEVERVLGTLSLEARKRVLARLARAEQEHRRTN